MVLALLQEVLVAPVALLLIAYPAKASQKREVNQKRPSPLNYLEPVTTAQSWLRQNSHSSQHFEGADAVHEDRLLTVSSGHKVSHAAAYGP